ncbi:hypothetical protein J437_LFUL012643 [Ladona fulva]|uniref:Ig-like domain-containing protein n=1 Tax=Ladona fulva TaxID=123851 RepID=A0A8K0KC23_LADFU|nr:hypothetical protein J437_LFUL012643 [Ladona fulva]
MHRRSQEGVLPKEGPKISGEDKSYQTGETIDLNCTASKSYPAATLRWYVNDRLVNSSERFKETLEEGTK